MRFCEPAGRGILRRSEGANEFGRELAAARGHIGVGLINRHVIGSYILIESHVALYRVRPAFNKSQRRDRRSVGADPPRRYLRGWAPAGDDQATSARRHGCDRRPRRIPGLAMARSAAGRRLDRMARRPPPAGREVQVPGCLSNVATRCLSRSRPASAIAAMPPIIAMIGPKDTAASSNSIAEPMRMAAIPPTAVNVCLSLCMTGSLPVLVKIQLLRPLCHLAGRWGGDDLSRRGALDGLVEEIIGCVRRQCNRADVF